MLRVLLLPALMVVSFLAVKLKQITKKANAHKRRSTVHKPADLLSALSHPDWHHRLHAVQMIADRQDVTLIPHLLAALEDKDHDVRVTAQEALEQMGKASVPGLMGVVEGGTLEARQAAVEALGHIGDSEAVPALLKGLKDTSMWVRVPAAEALGRLGHSDAVPGLAEALQDQDQKVRQSAANALRQIGTPQALQFLKDAS